MPAHAAENLIFEKEIPPSSRVLIHSFIEENIGQPPALWQVAAVDLNRDGLNEFILKPKSCQSQKPCAFQIIGKTDRGLLALGEIKARTLALGNGYTHGVRDLLAFSSTENDYAYVLYHWAAQRSRYILSEQ